MRAADKFARKNIMSILVKDYVVPIYYYEPKGDVGVSQRPQRRAKVTPDKILISQEQ